MKEAAPERRYRGRTATERHADRRQRLLDAGLELFGTSGYAATTVEALCQRAAVSSRDFYVHFTDREGLLRAVYEELIADTTTSVLAAVEHAPADLRSQAGAALDAFVSSFVRDPRRARVNFVEVIGVSPGLEEQRRAILHGFRDLIAERAAAVTGEVHPAELRLTATALVGATQESLIDWLLGGMACPPEDLVAELVEVYVAALESRIRRK